MEFKGTKGKWTIVEKGNTVKQLCIQVDESNKICGNISLKRIHDALLISKSPEMLNLLQYFIDNNMLSVRGEWMAIELIKEATGGKQ